MSGFVEYGSGGSVEDQPVEDAARAEYEATFRERQADLLRLVTPLGSG